MNPAKTSMIIALCWSAWPILARYAKVTSVWITAGVGVSSALTVLFILWFMGKLELPVTSTEQKALIVTAGILNAIGFLLYGDLMNIKGATQYIILLMVIIPILTYGASCVVFQEKFVLQKVVALVAVVGGMYYFLK